MRILVLEIPALHLGYLGCYGNDWVGTPNIDRLASQSVVFNRHYFNVRQPEAPAWTGHAFLDPSQAPSLSRPTLGEILGNSGIGLDYLAAHAAASPASLEEIVEQTNAARARQRSFIWVRFPSLAPPWDFPPDLLDSYCEEEDLPWPDPPLGPIEDADDLPRLQNTYAAVVTAVDAHLELILDQLGTNDHLDDTLVCLTSGEGLPLGEHGVIGAVRPWPHEEFVHLPLLLRLPRAQHAGWRMDALTQPVDLLPTFLEFLGVTPPMSHGQSLWPLINGEVSQVRPHAVSALNSDAGTQWALRTLTWAYILPVKWRNDDPSQPRLYVKPDDRWEVNDVRQHHLELADQFERTLRELAITGR